MAAASRASMAGERVGIGVVGPPGTPPINVGVALGPGSVGVRVGVLVPVVEGPVGVMVGV